MVIGSVWVAAVRAGVGSAVGTAVRFFRCRCRCRCLVATPLRLSHHGFRVLRSDGSFTIAVRCSLTGVTNILFFNLCRRLIIMSTLQTVRGRLSVR